jgi:cytochrome o ubiquinol oxidase subunit 3
MTDCILFATLFATYAVLRKNTFGGPTSTTLFNLPFALLETFFLLLSSFTCGLAILASYRRKVSWVLFWLLCTFLCGALFLGLELSEFARFRREGNGWNRSAFLSSFFTLVGTHGFHIACGLLWMIVLAFHLWRRGLTIHTFRRFKCFTLFWHFLDVVWIFIFTIVYLMGVAYGH